LGKGDVMGDTEMAYAAKFDGMPGFGAVCVDDADTKKDLPKIVGGWLRHGATVEHVTVEQAKEGLGEYLAAKKARATQGELRI